MEGCVIAGHGPDDGDEGHEDCDARWEVGSLVDGAPDGGGVGEAGEALLGTIGGGWDDDDDDDEGDDVEGAAVGVEGCDPAGRHAGNAAVDKHDEGCEEEDLVVLRDIGWVGD